MGDVRVVVTSDRQEFAEHAGVLLARRPVEHNVLATVVGALESGESTSAPLFAWVEAGESGEVSAAALRTPPRRLLASTMSAEAADALMAKLLEVDPELPGVNGPEPAASHLAGAWRRCTGGIVEPRMSQRIYRLAHVDEPRQRPAGHPRLADPSDRDLLVRWMGAFSAELGDPRADAERAVDRRLREGRLFLWDDGRVVSMVGTFPPVAGVVRLGPVYTPSEERRRGYATALVAEVSRRALAAGASRCMLYADLANPISNSIYQAVGYRRSREAREYAFSRDAAPRAVESDGG